VVTIAVPIPSGFLGFWTAFIKAFGEHLATLTGITSVQAAGLGDQAEMTLSLPTTGTWTGVGVTTSSLLSGCKQVPTAWHKWLPAPVPSAVAIEEPLGLGGSDVLGSLIPWVHSNFKTETWVQQNALKASTPFLVVMLSSGISIPTWIQDTSLLHHIVFAPAAPPDWGANAVIIGIAVVLCAAGAVRFNRRDLQGE